MRMKLTTRDLNLGPYPPPQQELCTCGWPSCQRDAVVFIFDYFSCLTMLKSVLKKGWERKEKVF